MKNYSSIIMPSRLEVFLYKRAAACFIFLLAAAAVLGARAAFMAGIPAGLVLSIWRFRGTTVSFSRMSALEAIAPLREALRSVAVFIGRELLLLLLMYASLKLDKSLFAGFVAGVFTIPLVVFVNVITESAGITHHQFESQVPNEF